MYHFEGTTSDMYSTVQYSTGTINTVYCLLNQNARYTEVHNRCWSCRPCLATTHHVVQHIMIDDSDFTWHTYVASLEAQLEDFVSPVQDQVPVYRWVGWRYLMEPQIFFLPAWWDSNQRPLGCKPKSLTWEPLRHRVCVCVLTLSWTLSHHPSCISLPGSDVVLTPPTVQHTCTSYHKPSTIRYTL